MQQVFECTDSCRDRQQKAKAILREQTSKLKASDKEQFENSL